MSVISKKEIDYYRKSSSTSKLWDYLDPIRQLRDAKVSYVQIKAYLEENDVKTSIQNIRQFYERNKDFRQQREIETNSNISTKSDMFEDLRSKK